MHKKTSILSFALPLILACAPALWAADPVVSSVSSAQQEGTKLVDITFDVSDADSDPLDISVELSDDAGTTFLVPVSALTGDTSVNAVPTNTSHALVWDAGVDFNQQFSSNMVVRVIADDGSAPGPAPAGMVLIPAGSFIMGDDSVGGDESPERTNTISAFYLDQFEVTKALWDDVAAWGLANSNSYSDLSAGGGQGAFHPVQIVNWYAAVKWCNARSEKEGLTPVYYTDATQTTIYRTGNIDLAANFVNWSANGFRLPTEAEWEKAARGTLVGNAYPWGNTFGGGDANSWASGDPFDNGTTPVGFYDGDQVPAGVNRANGYGLYDMAGNVYEWCWDWHDAGYYGVSPTNDPRGPASSPSGFRVLRGGSWNDTTSFLRCAGRFNADPVNAYFILGFRSARGL